MSKKRRHSIEKEQDDLDAEFKKIKVSTPPEWSSQTWVISTRTQPCPISKEIQSVESTYKNMNDVLKQLHTERLGRHQA